MKAIITVMLMTTMLNGAVAQVSTIDMVRVKGEYEKEAVYFYENNWKLFREEAVKGGYISGFELVKSAVDSSGVITMWLITHYGDDASYGRSEENFRDIIKRVSPGGPKMLNSVVRKDFILGVEGYSGKTLVRGSK